MAKELKKYFEDSEERRTAYALANALRPKRDGTLFEHFIVVGLPNDADCSAIKPKDPKRVKPKVLYQYPKNSKIPVEYIEHFCFPQGVEVTAIERTKSASGKNEVMFGQLSKVENTDNSYIFLTTGDQNLLYGICVANSELVVDFSSSFLAPKSMNEEAPTIRSRYDFVAPRCYCFLSRFPFFRLHFEVLYSVIARERLTKIARFMDVSEEELKLDKGNNIFDLLQSYYTKTVPTSENSSFKFQLPGELRSLEFVCPIGDEDKQIADWGIATTFKMLSLENILQLFRSVLLEKSIVIVCKNLGLLSAVVLSIIPTLRPYVFQGPFIPILPENLVEYLDAPVPYIIGVNSLPADKEMRERLEKEKVIVYVEQNKVTLPFSGVPLLPNQKSLYDTLKPYHTELNDKTKNAKPSYDHYLTVVQGIIMSFRSFHAWMMDEMIIKNVVLENETFDWDNPQKVEGFVHRIPKEHQEFLRVFVQSQQFSTYTEKLLELTKKKMATNPQKKPGHRKGSLSVDDFKNIFNSRLHRTVSSADILPSSPDRSDI